MYISTKLRRYHWGKKSLMGTYQLARGRIVPSFKTKNSLSFFLFVRIRHYKRRTVRGTKSLKIIKKAVVHVIKDKIKLCRAARKHDICKNFLKRFITSYKKYPDKVSFRYVSSSIFCRTEKHFNRIFVKQILLSFASIIRRRQ